MSNIIDIRSPLQAQLVSIHVDTGQQVQKGTLVATLELMKMQHAIEAPENGIITVTTNAEGQMIDEGQPIARIEVNDKQSRNTDAQAPEPTASALLELRNARALTMDVARPDAMAMRHAKGKRSARENISDLIDPESFREYGQLVFAAQRTRRDVDDLKRNTPADGLVAGLATINSDTAQKNDACVVMHYDYTVLAGTQGAMNHAKTDRLLKIAEADQRPVVFFTEGGGGRPGDVDVQT
ncbi:MAG: biotin/lipoyl-containing protein, partial [Pseudomonadota bacterium]